MATNGHRSVVRELQTLFSAGTACGLTDSELLERFVRRKGEASECAFAGLVERHGPMVLRVCRQILRDSHDAEDAFQAAFLVLARRAGSLRPGTTLAPWLHEVTLRTASRLRARLAHRRRLEGAAAATASRVAYESPLEPDVSEVLHAELGRLPAQYRVPLILCYLEGMTSEQAARHLGWAAGTVRSRLTRGRERLRVRLIRRGLAPAVAVRLAALSLTPAEASVPWALVELSSRAAVHVADRCLAAGAVSSSVITLSHEVLGAMAMIKLRVMATAVAFGLLATAWALGQAPAGGGAPQGTATEDGRAALNAPRIAADRRAGVVSQQEPRPQRNPRRRGGSLGGAAEPDRRGGSMSGAAEPDRRGGSMGGAAEPDRRGESMGGAPEPDRRGGFRGPSDAILLRELERKLDRILAVMGADTPAAGAAGPSSDVAEQTVDYVIGVQASLMDDRLRAHVDVPDGTGLVLSEVLDGSPADRAGLKIHDIVLEMGGVPLDKPRTLISQIRAAGAKPTAAKVLRKGRIFVVTVTPIARRTTIPIRQN
jgi:RNA polymerase sigma factor (sigma-70 family)